MMASELYDLTKEILHDPAYEKYPPSWHYLRAKLLIKIHLMEEVVARSWRFK